MVSLGLFAALIKPDKVLFAGTSDVAGLLSLDIFVHPHQQLEFVRQFETVAFECLYA